jgi:Fe-S-cluster containining protein
MKTELSLKQFVPSTVCLKCDGCCRYKEADSIWRPATPDGDIKTTHCGSGHLCRFLNAADNTCGVYAQRPFECSLYPFIISKTPEAVKLYAHLSCPFVQDHQPLPEFDAYVEYLKDFFSRPDIRKFLIDNKAMFHDYTPYAMELLYLFDLSLS